jgi:hypothetical protein
MVHFRPSYEVFELSKLKITLNLRRFSGNLSEFSLMAYADRLIFLNHHTQFHGRSVSGFNTVSRI